MAIQISTPAFTATRLPNGRVRVDGKGNNVTRLYRPVGNMLNPEVEQLEGSADRYPDEMEAVRNLI